MIRNMFKDCKTISQGNVNNIIIQQGSEPAEVLTPQSDAKADISCVDIGEKYSDAPKQT